MKDKFLGKYFPPAKTARLRSMIQEFRQKEGESFYETWECFKELLLKCPHHGLEDWALVEKFYHGVTPATRNMLNTTAGGNLMIAKTLEECTEMFEDIAMSSYEFPNSRDSSATQRGVHKVDDTTRMQAQIDALTKKMNDMESKKEQVCEICTGRYDMTACHIAPAESPEQLEEQQPTGVSAASEFVSGRRSRSRSEFGYEEPDNRGDAEAIPGQLAKQTQLLTQFITQEDTRHQETQSRFMEHETFMKSQNTALQNLERTVGSLADQLNQRPQGGLPSSTVGNPNATAKAVTTRSRRGAVEVELVVDEEPVEEEIEMETAAGKVHERLRPASTAQSSGSSGEKKEEKKEPMRVNRHPLPRSGNKE
ncbi:uncharacterized protein LOC110882943 [Helianthus annuus]|uniref:uncharacterized protein LOC110882943 n=1 Tax=Helianthus annuus TaxID=4232 RepID=UPI000B9048E7|nr:uncharacterized protein LOC110882943 [Helianthus annuus]